MEGAINMSKDEFVLHEWNKELFDNLVKYNEIENATNEGKALGLAEGKSLGLAEGKSLGIKETTMKIAKNMLKENIDLKTISKVTGLTVENIQNIK